MIGCRFSMKACATRKYPQIVNPVLVIGPNGFMDPKRLRHNYKKIPPRPTGLVASVPLEALLSEMIYTNIQPSEACEINFAHIPNPTTLTNNNFSICNTEILQLPICLFLEFR